LHTRPDQARLGGSWRIPHLKTKQAQARMDARAHTFSTPSLSFHSASSDNLCTDPHVHGRSRAYTGGRMHSQEDPRIHRRTHAYRGGRAHAQNDTSTGGPTCSQSEAARSQSKAAHSHEGTHVDRRTHTSIKLSRTFTGGHTR